MKVKLKLVRRGYYRFGNYQVMWHEDKWLASLAVPGFPVVRVCEGRTRDSVSNRLFNALFRL